MVCYMNILNVIYFLEHRKKKSNIYLWDLKKKLSFILWSKFQKLIYKRTGAFPEHSPAAFFS